MKYAGYVQWFNSKKGYGFIHSEELENDIFVCFGAILMDGYKNLNKGEVVEFEICKNCIPEQAVNVKKLNLIIN